MENMANYRTGRVNEELMRALCEIIRTVKDPRVSTAFISIISVDCTPDLKNAKIRYSVMGERRKGDAQKGLENATGYIRTQIAKMLNLRITPELKFYPDDSMKHGAHISNLMKQVEEELREADRRDAALAAMAEEEGNGDGE
jgi:ribosome-binding factor A